ncbi:MAG: TonB-dependent receptor [Bacteroidales bacterium]|nr:TonB-dependent receptor [Bacteroidales bacterium]
MKRLLIYIILSLVTFTAFGQNLPVTGVIKDVVTGEGVIGASVLIKGTTNGAVADINGEFSIYAPEGAVIVVSSIGYTDYEFTVTANMATQSIALQPSSEFLDDVVVVGYGSVKKENLTGAVDQISSEVFEGRPGSSATQMLVGSIPNLNITLADGKPGRTASYNVRGATSIGGGGSALILIDGVEGDPALLNPNDIESVSVLKDAASSSIYGSRATYGVVLITTKDPDKNKEHFSITYDGNFSFLQPTAVPDVVDDGYVYSRLFYEAWYNYNHSQPTGINKSQNFSRIWLDDFRERKKEGLTQTTVVDESGRYVYYGNTNYYDVLYKDYVFAHTHNLSASGTAGPMSYIVSGRVYDYDGLFNFNPDTYLTFNVRGKAKVRILKWLTLSENMEYTHEKQHIPMAYNGEGGGNFWRSIADEGHPSSPVFNPDRTLTKSGAYAIGGLVSGNNYNDRLIRSFKTTTALKASLLKDTLRLNADFSFSSRDRQEDRKRTVVSYSERPGEILYIGTPFTNDYFSNYYSLHQYIATNVYAEYENTWKEKHYFKALAGFNYENRKDRNGTYTRYGLLTPDVTNMNLAVGDEMTMGASETKWGVAGFFARLNYSYDDRYLIELNGRYDGSSKFPAGSQWGFFPSVSAAWRPSMEHFWKVNPAIISNLKFRVSYGELGNGNVAAYSFLEKFSFANLGGRILDGDTKLRYTSIPTQIPDNLTWETARTTDVGLDIGFLRGKINLTADWYLRRSYNMFTVGPTLPDTYGASPPRGNYADMKTYGFEISLSYNDSFNLAGDPFNIGFRATLADSRAFVTKFNNPTGSLDDHYVGEEIGEIWGFVCNGLFQNQAQIDDYYGPADPYTNNLLSLSNGHTIYPGDLIIEDLNGNKIIDYGASTVTDPGDRRIIGNSSPRYRYSFSLNLEWKGIFASVFFQGVGKQQWYPSGESPFWGQYNRPYNQALKWMIGNYWTKDNPDAYLPKYAGYYHPFFRGLPVSRYVQNVAYLRLQNLQVGWNLPKKWIQKARLSQVGIYFSGENLYTWSPMYKWTRDFDVVTVTQGSDTDITSDEKGDGFNYPSMRTFSIGVTIKY